MTISSEGGLTLSKRLLLLRITEASWWGSTTATAFSLLAIKDAGSFFSFLPYVLAVVSFSFGFRQRLARFGDFLDTDET